MIILVSRVGLLWSACYDLTAFRFLRLMLFSLIATETASQLERGSKVSYHTRGRFELTGQELSHQGGEASSPNAAGEVLVQSIEWNGEMQLTDLFMS
jgi:hypothetical protein